MSATTESGCQRILSGILIVLQYFSWAFSWPVIIGCIALVIGMGLSWITIPWFSSRMFILIFTGILFVACFMIIRLQKSAKSQYQRRSVPVLQVYMWSGLLLGLLLMVTIPDQNTNVVDAGINVQRSNSLVTPQLKSDPTIMAILQAIGAKDTANIETKFVAGYSAAEQLGEYKSYVDVAGKWSYGTLTAKQGLIGNELNVTIAHEYLHHIWFKSIDESLKIKLTSELITMYGNDSQIAKRLEYYSVNQKLQPTELFSFYCTESSDEYLTSYVLNECNKYINRQSLVFLR